MIDHSYVALKKEEYEVYAELKGSIKSRQKSSPSELKKLAQESIAYIKNLDIKRVGLAREMGMTSGSYRHLDAELEDSGMQSRDKTHAKKHADITFALADDYLHGRTSPEQNKVIYEHAKACSDCLDEFFMTDIANSVVE